MNKPPTTDKPSPAQSVTGDQNVIIGGSADGVTIITAKHEAPRVPTPFQLRAPVGDFVGREDEIARLTEAMRRGGSFAISGISGMGGIGKTELALKVADNLRDDFPDGQLFVELFGASENPMAPHRALEKCIRAFVGIEARLPDDLNDLINLYESVLSGKRVLVLLDNAANHQQVNPMRPPPGCALLMTSRAPIPLSGITPITLDQLKPDEARELLTGIAKRVTPEIADRICQLCGHLPLAVRAAGSLLFVTADLAPEDYASQLEDESARLEKLGSEGVPVGVEASFNLSYERLGEEASGVFRRLSVFRGTFDAGAEEQVCGDESHAHLSDLVRRSLVLYDGASKRYRLHDLMRLFVRKRIRPEESREAGERHCEYYLIELGAADDAYLRGGDSIKEAMARFDAERGNIEAGQKWAEERAGEEERAARYCSQYPDSGAYILHLRQHPRERIKWLKAGLSASRKLKDRSNEGNALGNLGLAYAALGETRKAIEFYEQALAVLREIGDRRGEGAALGNLGITYYQLGETRKAIEFYEQDLAIRHEIGDRRGEGNALGNLGNAYAALGETRKAIEFHEQALVIDREIGDRRGEGNALGNLGLAYADLGETRKAIGFYEQALVIDREIGDRRGEGNALGNLGIAYKNLGETRKAIEFYEQALVIDREIGDRRGEGNALFNSSLAFDNLGDRTEAIRLAEAALIIFRDIESPSADVVSNQLDEWRKGG